MYSKNNILDMLLRHKDEFKNRFSVLRIGLFGSYARDEAIPGSDIDLIVEFMNPTFDNYMDLKFYLENLFQTSVDLVLPDALKPRIVPYVQNEVIYA